MPKKITVKVLSTPENYKQDALEAADLFLREVASIHTQVVHNFVMANSPDKKWYIVTFILK